ncbi:8-oxo-dGTP diphosphatase [bacterium]|nr:8-oxo-dGTP diphosphatase [candidate division CSSED10-310 bacterium]
MIINATLCYIRQNDQTLMLCRNRKKDDIHIGKWNGLGGKFETGETPEECAIREIREESGLTAMDLELKGILTFPLFDRVNDWLVFAFLITRFSGTLIDSSEGELRWIPDNQLMALPLWEGDRIFLPWLNQSKFFSGKFIYSNGRLIQHSVCFYG